MENYTGKPQVIKQVNRDEVLRTIGAYPDVSQPEIAARTGLSLQTVNKVVRELEHSKTIVCTGTSEFTGGRRARVYKVNLNRGFIACVYIQGDCFYGKITNLGETVLSEEKYKRNTAISWTDNLLLCLKKLIGDFQVDIIGVAVPGTVTKDVIYNIPAIPEWESVNLKNIIINHYDCRILIENDMKSAAIWAYTANTISQNTLNMAYISFLEHIGAAFIIGGVLLEDRNRFNGEISYMALNSSGKTRDHTGCADQWLRYAVGNGDSHKLIQGLARILVNICCVIAPDLIVLETPYLNKEDVIWIKEEIAVYMQKEYIPSIMVYPVVPENNLKGIIAVCRNHLEATVRVVQDLKL